MKQYVAILFDRDTDEEINRSSPLDSKSDAQRWARERCQEWNELDGPRISWRIE